MIINITIKKLAQILLLCFTTLPIIAFSEITVYSFRAEDLIKPALEEFQKQSNIQIRLTVASGSGLLQRLINEGENTPADIIITNGVDDIVRLKQAGLLGKIPEITSRKSIFPNLISPDNDWVALAVRARVIVYNKNKVVKNNVLTYESLADEKFQGKLCARPSGNSYDPALIASRIIHFGKSQTEAWLSKIVANFARPPQGNDRTQIRDVANGICSVALVNSYYLGLMLTSSDEKDRELAKSVGVVFPGAKTKGTHINIAALTMSKWSKNQAEALQLINFLTSVKTQQWFSKNIFDYPVRKDVPPSLEVKKLGFPIVYDRLPLEEIGRQIPEAILLLDNAGWR
ncbi:MAG: extracellular solute-binding protein [Methylacidiphilales bacterium]|nr:extracellular solute-binding protein [Candidatus Methylacidiphilales bacterium]